MTSNVYKKDRFKKDHPVIANYKAQNEDKVDLHTEKSVSKELIQHIDDKYYKKSWK